MEFNKNITKKNFSVAFLMSNDNNINNTKVLQTSNNHNNYSMELHGTTTHQQVTKHKLTNMRKRTESSVFSRNHKTSSSTTCIPDNKISINSNSDEDYNNDNTQSDDNDMNLFKKKKKLDKTDDYDLMHKIDKSNEEKKININKHNINGVDTNNEYENDDNNFKIDDYGDEEDYYDDDYNENNLNDTDNYNEGNHDNHDGNFDKSK